MIKFIKNTGEYFSSNYFDEDFRTKVLSKTGHSADDIKDFNKLITPLKDRYYRFKQLYIEGKLRIKDKVYETHEFHTHILNALGFDGNHPQYNNLFYLTETEVLPIRHILYRGDKPHLMVMEMQALIKEDDNEPDGLFEQQYNVEDTEITNPPQRYHRSQWERVFTTPEGLNISPKIIHKAVSELFLLEIHRRPKYILLLAGNVLFLLEQEKWFRGSYLEFDLEELFIEGTANRTANYYALFYFLTGKETLAPDSNMVLLDQLDEDSHKSAYEVTKDLKEGIVYAIEALANEALFYLKEVLQEDFDETDDRFEQEVKDDCLRIIYRMLFIFYAESREDLDILPSNDPVYNRGYSLEMLRDLEQVPLYSENSLNGYFFHDSLSKLFWVLSSGYREKENGVNRSFRVRHIDSPIFDDTKLHHLHKVKFRNKVWQDIICRLSLSKQQRNKTRGRISYANLGINQLGSVYESLLAYRGFYAEQDYIEVHKAGKPQEGTYLVPRSRRDDFAEDEILKDDKDQDVVLKRGTFVYRLSGRDRQKSASYYTPEVLTQCTVKYTLKPILEKLDNSELKATDLLDMKLLEPAMGAAAFHNEMINQLAEAYLNYRQKELRDMGRVQWKVEPDKYKEELQKVKAYIATNNTYGVDLNPTAIELGKLSLWLNVIHRDMETPFFSNRICVGNAVIGAWLKVYGAKDIAEDTDYQGVTLKKQTKKEWWNLAPRQLEFKAGTDTGKIKHGRKPEEIYHFLLPDKNMVPSAGIKMLKEEYPDEAKNVTRWRSNWIKPITKTDLDLLRRISQKIDELLAEYYRFQRTINLKTATRSNIFGAYRTNEQGLLQLRSYDEKERLADQRNRHNSPYFKLKMVMDYWCSLWFWDVRQAAELPTRQQYWNDITNILELDTNKALDGIVERRGQQKLFETETQLSFAMEPAAGTGTRETAAGDLFAGAVVEYANRKDLFDKNQRLQIVSELASKYFFFHPQLEFLEVFWERGGFDLIAGNPPWIKITFEEKPVIADKYPEVIIKNLTAPEVNLLQSQFLKNSNLKKLYFEEMLSIDCASTFMNALQNYPLLIGQQTNLYKCVLVNGLTLVNAAGFVGLLHPEGIYDDPSGQVLRKEIYTKLFYHFQFLNELFLFQEVGHRLIFGISIYKGKGTGIDFYSINNLFHSSTIDGCFIHDGNGLCGGFKVKDESKGKFTWNTRPHSDRIIRWTENELQLFSELFEDSDDFHAVKLVNIQSNKIINALRKISSFEKRIRDFETIVTEGWHETNSINIDISRETKYVRIDDYDFIFSGPHFHVANPLRKTPRSICTEKAHYDVIDLTKIDEFYFSRTNYAPISNAEKYQSAIKGFLNKNDVDRIQSYDNWIDHYKLAFSKMLNTSSERTLQPAIIPPKTSHINGVISVTFKNEKMLAEFSALSSSIIFDFLVKTIGAANLTNSRLSSLPIDVSDRFKNSLLLRTLLLNCVNHYYEAYWNRLSKPVFKSDSWSKIDIRLKDIKDLPLSWNWNVPLRNEYSRRWALIEIDVIVAMAFNFTLEELIEVYNISFPLMQQYEDETYYDQKGNIVFTVNRGLPYVGVERNTWDEIQYLKAGDTYDHTIIKSELYYGQKVTYYAPFEKGDRVEDYKVAWGHFDKVFY